MVDNLSHIQTFRFSTRVTLGNGGNTYRRLVADLSIVYRYCSGNCSMEIKNIIPGPVRRFRTTRSSTLSRPFQVMQANQRTLSQQTSFIPVMRQLCLFSTPFQNPTTYLVSNLKKTVIPSLVQTLL